MNTTDDTKAILAGYQRALLSISKVAKDAVNPHFRSRYIPLDSIQEAVKSALLSEGLAFSQNVDYEPEGQCVSVTTDLHSADGGQIQIGKTRLPVPKMTPQDAGSAMTYCRRYALAALFAIVADADEDGEQAQAPYRAPAKPAPQQDAPNEPEGLKNDFTNPLKAAAFVFAGKRHVWADKTNESLSAIVNGVGSAAQLPEAIKNRAQAELDKRSAAK